MDDPSTRRCDAVLARARELASAIDEALDALAAAPDRARPADRDRRAVLDDLFTDACR